MHFGTRAKSNGDAGLKNRMEAIDSESLETPRPPSWESADHPVSLPAESGGQAPDTRLDPSQRLEEKTGMETRISN